MVDSGVSSTVGLFQTTTVHVPEISEAGPDIEIAAAEDACRLG